MHDGYPRAYLRFQTHVRRLSQIHLEKAMDPTPTTIRLACLIQDRVIGARDYCIMQCRQYTSLVSEYKMVFLPHL